MQTAAHNLFVVDCLTGRANAFCPQAAAAMSCIDRQAENRAGDAGFARPEEMDDMF